MKKILKVLLILFVLTLPFGWIQDTSYTIEDVQIRGWVDRSGTMVVNEIYTYTFQDEDLTNLTRVFPARHRSQIYNFQAYEIKGGQGKVGFVDDEKLQKLPVSLEDEIWKTKIPRHEGAVQVMYVYYVEEAVKTYQNYSDVDMTFYEDGPNHDVDIHNVDLSFILADGVGEKNIHGFFNASDASAPIVHTNGIEFKTPVSKAHTTLSARLLFPSAIMTEQVKRTAPLTLEEAIAKEELKQKSRIKKQAVIPLFRKITVAACILLVLIVVYTTWMQLRLPGRFGSIRYVMETDPLYLRFVDHAGNWQRDSFLAGLFSLVDKKDADFALAEPAEHMADQRGAEKTMEFHLRNGPGDLLPFERRMALWLFKGKLMKRKFHLHDIASGKESKEALNSQHKFEVEHKGWHEEVRDLLIDSGTLSRKLATGMRLSVLLISFLIMEWAFWIEETEGWAAVLLIPAVLLGISMISLKGRGKNGPALVYFIGSLFLVNSITLIEVRATATILLVIAFAVFFRIPETVLYSKTALFAKMSINKFRWEMQKGVPDGWTEEEKQQFLIRAYLLKTSKNKMPSVPGSQSTRSPLGMLFALPEDPMRFVFSQWGKPLLDKAGHAPEAETASKSGDGGYSGDSGGGGDGGGGAGAD